MVYFCHVPVFNTRTENEERGWFLSPYLCSLLLDILPWSLLLSALLAHLPKSLPRVSMPSHQHRSYSLSGLFRMLLVLSSLQSHANAKKTIYSWSTHANALHPGFNPSTEFNRWYCKKVVYWLRTPWAVLLEGRCCVSIISVSPGPRLVPGTPGGVLWGFSLQCMERLTEDGKYCAESRQKKMLAGSYVLFGLHAV